MQEWLDSDVAKVKDRTIRWLSEQYFFRDPARSCCLDPNCFLSPADGIIVYQTVAKPQEEIINIKGKHYTLRDAMQNPRFDKECLVIGIFMTFYDVHVNRVPLSGRLMYQHLNAIGTYNHPMLDLEKNIIQDLKISFSEDFLFNNERMLNKVFSAIIGQEYYVLQIADYDVDRILPFKLEQNLPVYQGDRFSIVRYGSQVDLIVPLSDRYELQTLQSVSDHVEAGVDPLVKII